MIPFFESVKPYINHYGYWAVFFCVFLESLGLPLPGETLIIVAGLYAAKGTLNPIGIVLLAVTATFIANNISYVIGYFCGRSIVIKYGKYVFINEQRLLVLEDFVMRYGNKVLLVARFILGLRQLNGIIMGTLRLPWLQFAVFNMIGAILWAGGWIGASYYLGKKLESHFIEYAILIGVAAFIVSVLMVYNFFKKYL